MFTVDELTRRRLLKQSEANLSRIIAEAEARQDKHLTLPIGKVIEDMFKGINISKTGALPHIHTDVVYSWCNEKVECCVVTKLPELLSIPEPAYPIIRFTQNLHWSLPDMVSLGSVAPDCMLELLMEYLSRWAGKIGTTDFVSSLFLEVIKALWGGWVFTNVSYPGEYDGMEPFTFTAWRYDVSLDVVIDFEGMLLISKACSDELARLTK